MGEEWEGGRADIVSGDFCFSGKLVTVKCSGNEYLNKGKLCTKLLKVFLTWPLTKRTTKLMKR